MSAIATTIPKSAVLSARNDVLSAVESDVNPHVVRKDFASDPVSISSRATLQVGSSIEPCIRPIATDARRP
jgi:hypothetical protein